MFKLVVFDFDGVFTDGKCAFDPNGFIIKSYNIKDGMGIKLLKDAKINIGVISGFKSNKSQIEILNHLKIINYEFNVSNKIEVLNTWCNKFNIKNNEIAYMGDDINDIDVMNYVGLSGCPKNAHKLVLNISNFISSKNGGDGCIREFCEFILKEKKNKSILTQIKNECIYQLNNFSLLDIEKLKNKIIDTNKNNNIYFTGIGKSENIAIHTSNLLKSLNYKVFYLNACNSLHGDLGILQENDLIILYSKSGNTKELINIIPYLKTKKVIIYGICCNKNSEFLKLCDEIIILPFKQEIQCNINTIPTNSYMSFLFFTNFLVSSLCQNLTIDSYRYNHPAGDIGKNLLKISDVIIHNFPKIIMKGDIELTIILLEMTKLKIGCCFFVDENNILLGLLTDGDIRRILLKNINFKYVSLNNINTNFYYETDKNKFIKDCKKIGFIAILEDKKIIGVVKN